MASKKESSEMKLPSKFKYSRLRNPGSLDFESFSGEEDLIGDIGMEDHQSFMFLMTEGKLLSPFSDRSSFFRLGKAANTATSSSERRLKDKSNSYPVNVRQL
jgi:hypothetical protein